MPSWGEIGREIEGIGPSLLNPGVTAFDVVRRKYLAAMFGLTGRATILYATKWTMPGTVVPLEMLTITPNDIHGFMGAIHGVTETELDLIIHSPGGAAKQQKRFFCTSGPSSITLESLSHIWQCQPPRCWPVALMKSSG